MNATAFVLFCIIVAITLLVTYWAARRTRTTTDFYAAGRSIRGWQNGIAIAGDYMSAASFLGIAGLIALFGYDGFLYSVGWLVAYLVVLLIVAEPLRNSGRYTIADMLAYRMKAKPVRSAAALSTLAISTFYMIAQLVGAGGIIKLLLDIDYEVVDHHHRRADDPLCGLRRHAGHHLGTDRQGRAAHDRYHPAEPDGPGQLSLQPGGDV